MLRTAKFLLLLTILYNIVEGVIVIWSGLVAGSIALVAFGADSYIEVFAASLVLWRLGIPDGERTETVERITVQIIGWTFLVLSAAVVFRSAVALVEQSGAEESFVGIGLASVAATFQPLIIIWRLRIAQVANLRSLAIEAKERVAYSFLSLALLIGLVANALLGRWWLDSATALLLVPWLVREGLDGIRG